MEQRLKRMSINIPSFGRSIHKNLKRKKIHQKIQETFATIYEMSQTEQEETQENQGNLSGALHQVAGKMEKGGGINKTINQSKDVDKRKELRKESSKSKKPLKSIREDYPLFLKRVILI